MSEFSLPRPEDGLNYLSQETDIAQLATFGIPRDEALAVLLAPKYWTERLAEDFGAIDEIYEQVVTVMDGYESAHGPSEYWDDVRSAMAGIFLVAKRPDLAANLFVRTHDAAKAIESGLESIDRGLMHGLVEFDAFETFAEEMRRAYRDANKAKDINDAVAAMQAPSLTVKPMLHKPDGARRRAKPEQVTFDTDLPLEHAQVHYNRAPWDSLLTTLSVATLWPDGFAEDERSRIVIEVAARLHTMVQGDQIERRDAEAIKAFIAEKQAGTEADVWDMLRFITTLSLYVFDAPKYGRILARSMDAQEVVATVVHTLLEQQRYADARDLLWDIKDPVVIGKILVAGNWKDRREVDALLNDIVVVTTTTRRKHDPQLRIGVAKGAVEAYASAGEDEKAAKMQKHAELLERQIASGYIVAPKRKK